MPAESSDILYILNRIKVNPDTGCWEWTLKLTERGYARCCRRGEKSRAHRLAYETFIGPIPEGLQVDHLCHVRHCCNPEHLEAVTNRENVMRGDLANVQAHRRLAELGVGKYEGRRAEWRRECIAAGICPSCRDHRPLQPGAAQCSVCLADRRRRWAISNHSS